MSSTTTRPVLDPATTVRTFLALLEDHAVDQALEYVDPGMVWRNTGLPTVRGKIVRRLLRGMNSDSISFRADMHHVAADGAFVLTQRTDYLRIGPIEAEFWVCGTFEVRDGKVVLWDDHFSWGNVMVGTLRGVLRTARSAVR
ncbi:limonene-1,2-epoxide hydrolase family protein [Nocardioides panacisoli]